MSMASDTWFDLYCSILIPEMGIILGNGTALISLIYYGVPEGADNWQACRG